MASQSTIEWTEMTWNPTTGCDKISAGCKFCYAELMSKRLKSMGMQKYQNGKNGFDLTLHPDTLAAPYTWKTPKIVFVNSMSDLFHKDVPIDFIQEVFRVMRECKMHTFQVLTKRAKRLSQISSLIDWPENVWMGVSVENQKVMERIELLSQTDAKVKFLSCEPLIGPLPNMNLSKIDWVIVGGESGHRPRPMDKTWVIDIKNQCHLQNIPFFFKQWGGTNKKKTGRELDGNIYSEMPEPFQANYSFDY